jgi:hypothetical protein
MKSLYLSIVFVILLLMCSDACAQFRTPPRTPPSTCDRLKEGGYSPLISSDCKAILLALDVSILLDCNVIENEIMLCTSHTTAFNGASWEVLDPSTLTHNWDYIADGQEHSLSPSYSDSLMIACSSVYSRIIPVRVSAGGAVAQVDAICPGRVANSW